MKSLITQERVVALAFGDGEFLSPEAICEADIAIAESRYLRPVVGDALWKALLEGKYPSLVEEYVAPALAMAVRTLIQPALNVRTGQCGLSIAATYRSDSATKSATESLLRSLVKRRKALFQRLSEHLKTTAAEYVEYDVSRDALQKCSIYGGIVQIH